jgi:hypothetical protein
MDKNSFLQLFSKKVVRQSTHSLSGKDMEEAIELPAE